MQCMLNRTQHRPLHGCGTHGRSVAGISVWCSATDVIYDLIHHQRTVLCQRSSHCHTHIATVEHPRRSYNCTKKSVGGTSLVLTKWLARAKWMQVDYKSAPYAYVHRRFVMHGGLKVDINDTTTDWRRVYEGVVSFRTGIGAWHHFLKSKPWFEIWNLNA